MGHRLPALHETVPNGLLEHLLVRGQVVEPLDAGQIQGLAEDFAFRPRMQQVLWRRGFNDVNEAVYCFRHRQAAIVGGWPGTLFNFATSSHCKARLHLARRKLLAPSVRSDIPRRSPLLSLPEDESA